MADLTSHVAVLVASLLLLLLPFALSSPSSFCTWINNTDYYGPHTDPPNGGVNLTREECCDLCARTPNCSFAVHGSSAETPPRSCWFKTGLATKNRWGYRQGATTCCPVAMASAGGCPAGLPPPFDVTTFGAVGDGTTDDTHSIAEAMAAAAAVAASGSPVVVRFPAGKTFLTGPLNMTSSMTLQVDGVIRAKSGNNTAGGISRWPQIPPLPTYGNSRDGPYLQYQAFIYARGAHDIRVNGSGTIDGQGDWWWHNQRNRTALGAAGRPNLLQFVGCAGVEVAGVTLRDSPFWCLHPVLCEDVHVHHVTIRARMYAPNSDGIDPDSSKNVLIEHNDVSCGDDHIAIKAGVCGASSPNSCLDPNFRDGTYATRNVTVRYNTFRIGMGISVGSESSGGIHDVSIYDNVVGLCEAGHCLDRCCGWGPALHFKTALTRGNAMTNIAFVNNTVYNNTGFIDMETNYQSGDNPPSAYPPTLVANVTFRGNRALGAATGVAFVCSVHDVCENITVEDNVVESASPGADPWHCEFVDTFTVSGNSPGGLAACMKNSIPNRSTVVL